MLRTLVLMMPDGVQGGLTDEILRRHEKKGLKIAALGMLKFDAELVIRHYGEHAGKPFFEGLKTFIMSGPVVAAVIEGDQAISLVRLMMGATKFTEAAPGTI